MEDLALMENLPLPPQQLIPLLAGILLLLAGRKLFWLALGLAGFAAGLWAGSRLPLDLDPNLQLAVAVLCGILGALAAALVRKVAIPVAGFLAGGLGASYLAEAFAPEIAAAPWLGFLMGGIFGLLLAALLVNAGLIVISALVGASTILEPFALVGPTAGAAFLGLALVGIAIQSRGWGRRKGR